MIAVFAISIEIIVLLLQHKYGGNFFIPKSMRKSYYNYYKTIEEVKKIKTDLANVNYFFKLVSLLNLFK